MKRSEYHKESDRIINEVTELSRNAETQLETSKFLSRQADLLLKEMEDESLTLEELQSKSKLLIGLLGRLEAEIRMTERDGKKIEKCERESKSLHERRRLEGLQ